MTNRSQGSLNSAEKYTEAPPRAPGLVKRRNRSNGKMASVETVFGERLSLHHPNITKLPSACKHWPQMSKGQRWLRAQAAPSVREDVGDVIWDPALAWASPWLTCMSRYTEGG